MTVPLLRACWSAGIMADTGGYIMGAADEQNIPHLPDLA
jgi:hypothetical protein